MTSPTPCRFYAQGNCRYGNSCRFYHEPRGQSGGFFGNRTLAPATFQPSGGVNQGVAKTNQNLDTLVEVVKKDMQEWQNCKIWPYSCYGPVGGKPCMPGFEDLSAEEFRLAYIQCGNNLPPEIIMRFGQIQQLRVNYQQPTMENRAIIERLATSSTPGAITSPTSPFGNSGVFGNATNPKPASIFGGAVTAPSQQQTTTGSIFGGGSIYGGSSTFGQQSNASLFQSSAAQQQLPVSTASGVFSASQNQTPSIFGQASQQQQPPLFQQPQSIFQQGPSAKVFQQPTQPGGGFFQQAQVPVSSASQFQGGLFSLQQQQPPNQQPSSGLFQQNPNVSANMFPAAEQQKPFGTPTGSIFGGGMTQDSAARTGSIFGGGGTAQQPPPSIFGAQARAFGGGLQVQSTQIPLKCVYSEESELSPEELEAFKAPDFTIDSLPLKLPPRSLCM